MESIHQQGPTCGIYAIAMIISALDNEKLISKYPQELASKIFNIAITKEISIIGEIFSIYKVKQLLDEVSANIWTLDKSKLEYSIVEFSSPKDMSQKTESALSNGYYILFPFNKNNINSNIKIENNTMHTHWGMLYGLNNNKVLLREGNNNSKYNNMTLSDLYTSNQSLEVDFKWSKYLQRSVKKLLRRFDDFCNTSNQDIKDKINDILDHKKKELIKESIKLDVKGKMIVIRTINK